MHFYHFSFWYQDQDEVPSIGHKFKCYHVGAPLLNVHDVMMLSIIFGTWCISWNEFLSRDKGITPNIICKMYNLHISHVQTANKTQVYWQRWWILAIFSLFTMWQCSVWNTWTPIAKSAQQVNNFVKWKFVLWFRGFQYLVMHFKSVQERS